MNRPTYRNLRWTILSLAFLAGVLWLSWPRETPRVAVMTDSATDVASEDGAPLGDTPSVGPLSKSNTKEEASSAEGDVPSEDAPTETAEGETEDSKYGYFTATIQGRVVDSTGVPIAGAVLEGVDSIFDRFPSMREMDDGIPRPPPADEGAPEEWGTTDETGYYRIELRLEVDKGVTELEISLFAILANWSARSEERDFSPLRAGETVTQDFVVDLPGAVTGRIVDDRGAPLEGIKFTLHAVIGIRPSSIIRTSADGRFEVKHIAAGLYHVVLLSREWRLASSAVMLTVKSGETSLIDDIQVQRVTMIRITLTCDQDPPPWAGERDKPFMAVVWLFTKDEQELSRSEIVDFEGTITMYDLPAEGVTDVRVDVPGFSATGWFALFLREGEMNEASFALVAE
ncbi:MAG: carboxypeptidase-like regulatory domain-containing protein [Planctomycetes bacterium]|nr:carboxypeptidase-like regulatory domain-containing protein [Planctomycetota bacterium]